MANEFTFAEDNAERPVTMFGPDFPFPSTIGSRTRPDLVRSPGSATARKLPSSAQVCPAWWRRTNS